jgi:rod shape determining protein RodA
MVDYASPTVRAEHAALALGAYLRRLDWVLVAAVGALVGIGLWAIGGITRDDIPGDPDYYVIRQGVFAALGTVGFFAALVVDPDVYRRYWRFVYGAMIGLLLLVLAVGEVTRGSKRWIEVGFFRFQPSEFGKLLLVLALAGFLAGRTKRLNEWRTVAGTVGLAGLAMLLVFVEPDVGTSLV